MNKVSDSSTKVFRAEKTTQNRDDFKVLMVGAMFTIIMMLTVPIIGKVYDLNWADRPFVRATVELIQTGTYDRPMVLYDADAIKVVDATWTAVIRDEEMIRIGSRQGTGVYTDKSDNPRLWTWAAFFDNGVSETPKVPDEPFHVCVSYVSMTRISGVTDETPEICSKLFHPSLGGSGVVRHSGATP